MPIVNYVREHTRFMEYATDEHLTASERLLWYALMHIMNQRAQGNVWPEEFIRVSNDRLLSYCPMKFDTMANARNGLIQRGLIEYTKGEKNKLSPAYRMHYFYPQYIAPETEKDAGCYPEKSYNMGGNMGGNTVGNMGDNTVGNMGDISINYTNTDTFPNGNPGEIHTLEKNGSPYPRTRAREGGYIGKDGLEYPARYDSAWRTSEKARGAVAQRLLNQYTGEVNVGSDLHGFILERMEYGMPPELIEDIMPTCKTSSRLKAELTMLANTRGYTEEKAEWKRCLTMTNGNEALARQLYRQRYPDDERAEAQ